MTTITVAVGMVVVIASALWAVAVVGRSRREVAEMHHKIEGLDRAKRELLAERAKLRREVTAVRQVSVVDPIVDLPNRSAFLNRLDLEWKRARRHGDRFSVVLVEARLDPWPPHARDAVLRKTADELRRSALRETDLLASLGDGRFGIILADTHRQRVSPVIDRIRHATRNLNDHHMTYGAPKLDLGLGVGEADPRRHPTYDRFMESFETGFEESRASNGLLSSNPRHDWEA